MTEGIGFLRSLLGQDEDDVAAKKNDRDEDPAGEPQPPEFHGAPPASPVVTFRVPETEPAPPAREETPMPPPVAHAASESVVVHQEAAHHEPPVVEEHLDPTPRTVMGLKSPDIERRRVTLRALMQGNLDATAIAAVAGVLQDPEHALRSLALQVLERAPRLVPVEPLASAALDPDPAIRARALTLLGRSGEETVLPILHHRVLSEDDEAVVGAAFTGMVRLIESLPPSSRTTHVVERVATAVSALAIPARARFRREIGLAARLLDENSIRQAMHALDANVRRGGVTLATEHGSAGLLDELSQLSADPDTQIRESALAAYTRIHPSAQPPRADEQQFAAEQLRPVEVQPQPVAREEVPAEPRAGGDVHDATLPALIGALTDPESSVRSGAERALQAIDPARLSAWLLAKLDGAQSIELGKLATVAARLHIDDAVPVLAERALNLEPGHARVDVLTALRELAGTEPFLAAWRNDPERARRIDALRLGAMIDPFGTAGVEAALADSNAAVRIAAIETVGEAAAGPRADALLGVLATDSSADVRMKVLRAFRRSEPDLRVRAAQTAMRDSTQSVREEALGLLSEGTEGEVSLLARAVHDPDTQIAARAAGMLAKVPGAEGLAALWSVLRTAPIASRGAIFDALSQHDRDAVARLARRAFESNDQAERSLGLAMLVRVDGEEATPRLVEALTDPATEVRSEALQALMDRPGAIRVDIVGARIRDPQVRVRRLAVMALGAVDDDAALPFLLEASHDPSDEVRRIARDTILQRSSGTVARLLVRALGTPSVRRAAIDLLVEMGEGATEELLGSLDDADPEVRRGLAEVFRQSGAIGAMVEDLHNRHPDRRRRAIEGIGVVRAQEAVEPLIGALEDPDSSVRAAAAGVLAELGDPRAVEPLRRAFVSDPDMDVVARIEAALRKLSGPRTFGVPDEEEPS